MCGESQKKGNHLVNFREMFVLVLGVCVQEAKCMYAGQFIAAGVYL